MGVVTRLTAMAVTFVVLGVSTAIGNALGAPTMRSITVGLFVAGVFAVSANFTINDAEADAPLAVAGFLMLLLAAVGAIPTGKEIWPQANAFLLFAGAGAVAGSAIVLVRWAMAVAMRAIVRARRSRRRRRLARDQGWRFEADDADLPSVLGGREHVVLQISGAHVQGTRPVPQGARAHDVVRGEVDGVEFVAFDYLEPRRLEQPVFTTACVVRLPHALPAVTSAEVLGDVADSPLAAFFGQPGGEGPQDLAGLMDQMFGPATGDGQSRSGGSADGDERGRDGERQQDSARRRRGPDPGYLAALRTEEVLAVTREHLPSWWVDGTLLASTSRRGHGDPPEALLSDLRALAALATALSAPRLAHWAGRTTRDRMDAGPDSGEVVW